MSVKDEVAALLDAHLAADAANEQAAADRLAGVQATLSDTQAALTAAQANLAAAQTEIARLNALYVPPLPSGWGKVTFADYFTDPALPQWRVRNVDYSGNEKSMRLARNVSVADGVLTIRAKRETYTTLSGVTRDYTSGYLDTIGRFSQQYGRWEMRAKLPTAQGLWPAFWLRGNAGLGEIDIMEAVGGTGKTVQTVHQSTNGGQGKYGHEDALVTDLTAWHVYAVEREPGIVRWFIDDRQVFSVDNVKATWLDTTFNEPMNMRLNLQVGGSMPDYYQKPVTSSTPFPADMVVDYVRVLSR